MAKCATNRPGLHLTCIGNLRRKERKAAARWASVKSHPNPQTARGSHRGRRLLFARAISSTIAALWATWDFQAPPPFPLSNGQLGLRCVRGTKCFPPFTINTPCPPSVHWTRRALDRRGGGYMGWVGCPSGRGLILCCLLPPPRGVKGILTGP